MNFKRLFLAGAFYAPDCQQRWRRSALSLALLVGVNGRGTPVLLLEKVKKASLSPHRTLVSATAVQFYVCAARYSVIQGVGFDFEHLKLKYLVYNLSMDFFFLT